MNCQKKGLEAADFRNTRQII